MSKKIKVACVEWHVILKVGENSNCKSSSGHDVSVSLLPYTKSTSLVCLSLLHSYSESEFGQEKNATVGLTLWLSLYLEQSRTDLANSSHLHCKQASECSQGVSELVQTAVWRLAACFSWWHLLTPFCTTQQLRTCVLHWSGVTIEMPCLIVEHCWLLTPLSWKVCLNSSL